MRKTFFILALFCGLTTINAAQPRGYQAPRHHQPQVAHQYASPAYHPHPYRSSFSLNFSYSPQPYYYNNYGYDYRYYYPPVYVPWSYYYGPTVIWGY